MNNTIGREERLFRSVPKVPGFWKNELGRPTSALFKTDKGVSVDRNGQRDANTIVTSFKDRFGSIKAVVYLNASYCLDLGVHLVYKPEDDNVFHAEIHQSPEKVMLSKGLQRQLASECAIVYED